jgi:uncharacterized protein YecE (DUF72 family)
MAQYLVGTGGWAYFKVPNEPSLKAYSRVFNFVEVNSTFYKYPDTRMVEHWRRVVPKDFTFTIRCHQDLTHRIGLKPVDEAYDMFNQMIIYCRILDSPFLLLETPARYTLDENRIKQAQEFFSTISLKGVRLAWETRNPLTSEGVSLMQRFNIVHCVDLSKEEPSYSADVIYARLFGKGKHNIWQFTDDELEEVDRKIVKSEAKVVVMSFHGVRMNMDAARFEQYKETGAFPPATSFIGVDSARVVLNEDAKFPSSKADLIEHQGWKVIDLTVDRRIHLSELLSKIPERIYNSLDEVIQTLEVH